MAQYKTGTVTVTTGLNAVTGDNSVDWSTIQPGSWFSVEANIVPYQIASVDVPNRTLLLSVPYAGASATGVAYRIWWDFTTLKKLPLLGLTDLDWAVMFNMAMQILDTSAGSGGSDVAVNSAAQETAAIAAGATGVLRLDLVGGTAPADITTPTVTAFTIPATSNTLSVSISSFTATDNVGVTGYLITESATAPLSTASGWNSSVPTTYSALNAGTHTLYAWAKDAAGNVSTSLSASVTITIADSTAPTITAFTMPSTSSSLAVSVTSFTATDNVGVTQYLINESATTPSLADPGWVNSAPTSYTFSGTGARTAYAWVRDAAGNISASASASVTISATDVTAGDFNGDGVPDIAVADSGSVRVMLQIPARAP